MAASSSGVWHDWQRSAPPSRLGTVQPASEPLPFVELRAAALALIHLTAALRLREAVPAGGAVLHVVQQVLGISIRSGAVVIPDGQVEDVIVGARAVKADDERYREQIERERLPTSREEGAR